MNKNLREVLAQAASKGLDSPEWTTKLLAAHRELAVLEANDRKLAALEGAGVDNWEGYDEAMRDIS